MQNLKRYSQKRTNPGDNKDADEVPQELLNDERVQERIQIAERMLKDGIAIEDIINYTQLTEEQLRELMSNSQKH